VKGLCAFIAGLALIATAQAGDFWKAKPVRDWTLQETQRFLRDSPWVHPVRVGGSLLDAEPPMGSSQTEQGRRESSGAEGGTSTTAVDVDRGGPAGKVYFVEWSSAKIVRQAGAHWSVLQGRGNEEAEPQPAAFYVVTVNGPDFKVFDSIPDGELKSFAFLRLKRTNGKVGPMDVKIRKTREGRVVGAQFAFPHEVNGQPTIPDQEKSVEFVCQAKDFTLKTSFNLSKMTAGDGPDL
jgi:hypothetical protein